MVYPADSVADCVDFRREFHEQSPVREHCGSIPDWDCDDTDCVELPEGWEEAYGGRVDDPVPAFDKKVNMIVIITIIFGSVVYAANNTIVAAALATFVIMDIKNASGK